MSLKPHQTYTKEQLKLRCSNCFASHRDDIQQAAAPNTSLAARVTRQTVEEKSKKQKENMQQMKTLFTQFKATVNMDEKDALKVFLKLMEGGPEVVPPEFRGSAGGPAK
jgi:hypothetical protein